MRTSVLYGATILTLFSLGCTRDHEIDPIQDQGLSLFAETEEPTDTRTIVESGTLVYWEPGDEIAVFSGEKSGRFVTDLTSASATTTFRGSLGDDAWTEGMDLWALYPYSAEAVFDGESITTTLPSVQVARTGSFGKDMNITIAHSTSTTLQFYNVGGGICFTVTEEGIKKVIFEGLSGEIISGKVKIGFENGLPKVQEVSEGSQFITLLPPSEQNSFQKNTWYYIVAIPGALESGYKLRFYKDSDYAKKVSTKAVTIKRSIFGNLAEADSVVGYEPTTTRFPETDAEWEASIALTQLTSNEIGQLISRYQESEFGLENLVKSVRQVDGIIETTVNNDSSVITVIQRDSVCVNYVIRESIDNDSHYSFLTETSSHSKRSVLRRAPILEENSFISPSKKALILAPFSKEFKDPIKEWEALLTRQFSSVSVYDDEKATIECFTEDFLGQYDFILISTHGDFGYSQKPWGFFSWHDSYCLSSASQYSETEIRKLNTLGIQPEERSVVWRNWKWYLCMTPMFLKNKRLNNCAVVLSACESAKERNEGSMVDSFLSNGARIISGTLVEVYNVAERIYIDKMLDYMSHGLSYQSAYNYIMTSEKTQEAIFALQGSTSNNIISGINIPNEHWMGSNKDNEPFFIMNSFPNNLVQTNSGTDVVFSWDCNLEPFDITWFDSIEGKESKEYPYTIRYDLYINGAPVITNLTEKQVSWNPESVSNPSTWYVVAKIMEDDTIIESFKSDVEPIIGYIRPEMVDLGLSVKWATCNLGASKPEKYGDYYAWGETEPKKEYSPETYKWCMLGSTHCLTKYCSKSNYGYNGFTDAKTVLDLEDDVAHVKLGGSWRMPSNVEWYELFTHCTWTGATQNGVKGIRVTAANGDSIFIPTAGYRFYTSFDEVGSYGYYWSSTLSTSIPSCAWTGYFNSVFVEVGDISRWVGLPVRPVCAE